MIRKLVQFIFGILTLGFTIIVVGVIAIGIYEQTKQVFHPYNCQDLAREAGKAHARVGRIVICNKKSLEGETYDLGTTFPISSDTWITAKHVTNNADKASELYILDANDKVLHVKRMIENPDYDLTILKTSTETKLPALEISSQDAYEFPDGEKSTAYGFDNKQTRKLKHMGIIYADEIEIGNSDDLNDADLPLLYFKGPIKQGYSGGPLFDADQKKVIGVSVMGTSESLHSNKFIYTVGIPLGEYDIEEWLLDNK